MQQPSYSSPFLDLSNLSVKKKKKKEYKQSGPQVSGAAIPSISGSPKGAAALHFVLQSPTGCKGYPGFLPHWQFLCIFRHHK